MLQKLRYLMWMVHVLYNGWTTRTKKKVKRRSLVVLRKSRNTPYVNSQMLLCSILNTVMYLHRWTWLQMVSISYG